jgi:RNA polymerase sigma factor (sigma-70 family)
MLTENDLKKIIDENQAALLRYAERLLREDLLAQDAVQVAFINFIKNKPEKIKNPRAWLFKILRNHCFNILRKQKKNAEVRLDETNMHKISTSNSPRRKARII